MNISVSHPRLAFELCTVYRGVRVIVLGATGFIGRWVANRLSEAGADLVVTARDRSAMETIQEAYCIRGRVESLDLTDDHALRELIHRCQPAVIFNLCGYGVDRHEQDPDTSHLINCQLVETLCDSLRNVPSSTWAGQRLVHTGTVAEYGTTHGDLAEDSDARPTTFYGRTKLEGTHALATRCRQSGLRSLTARLPTVYGPGEHAGRLLPSLLDAARHSAAISLTAGLQKRDFIYVVDVADGLLRLGLTTPPPGTIVNLATGYLASVRTFIETAAPILGIVGRRLLFGDLPMRSGEMSHEPITIARLLALAYWRPPTNIEIGIRHSVHFASILPR